jgi:hypothetical protein
MTEERGPYQDCVDRLPAKLQELDENLGVGFDKDDPFPSIQEALGVIDVEHGGVAEVQIILETDPRLWINRHMAKEYEEAAEIEYDNSNILSPESVEVLDKLHSNLQIYSNRLLFLGGATLGLFVFPFLAVINAIIGGDYTIPFTYSVMASPIVMLAVYIITLYKHNDTKREIRRVQ